MSESPAYQMLDYTWFDMVGGVPSWPAPFYLGRGKAMHAGYRSEKHPPMPGYGVVKIALSPGGVMRLRDGRASKLQVGEATLRTVGEVEVNDGYDPEHTGTWEFVGLMFHGEAAIPIVKGLQDRFGHRYRLDTKGPIVKQLLAVARQPTHTLSMTAADGMAMVLELLTELARSSERESSAHGRVKLVQAVEQSIMQNLHRDLRIEELAAMHEVSREHLTRLFAREMGVAPYRYITERRMREACRLLRYSNVPLKQIMVQVGFSNRQTFYRTFRRAVGVTPHQYRMGAYAKSDGGTTHDPMHR